MDVTYYLYIYIATISIVSVLFTIYDKIASKKRWARVPEKLFLSLGILGGAIPMFITMLIIHHKTRHKMFKIGLPIEILINLISLFAVLR